MVGGHAWQSAFVALGVCGVHGRGVSMVGGMCTGEDMCGRRHAWL